MCVVNIGDMVAYNGYDYEGFYDYEKEFVDDNLIINDYYKVLSVMNMTTSMTENRNIIWYRIEIDGENSYWVPSLCFDIKNRSYIGYRYNLK
jgi:hypothetical protein